MQMHSLYKHKKTGKVYSIWKLEHLYRNDFNSDEEFHDFVNREYIAFKD